MFILVFFILDLINYDIFPSTVILLGLLYFLFVWLAIYVNKKITKNKDKINEIKRRLADLNEEVTPVYIPRTYINDYALSKLKSYFSNRRADTLKEALNLFEDEMRHNQQMREINTVRELQEVTFKKADSMLWFIGVNWNRINFLDYSLYKYGIIKRLNVCTTSSYLQSILR